MGTGKKLVTKDSVIGEVIKENPERVKTILNVCLPTDKLPIFIAF